LNSAIYKALDDFQTNWNWIHSYGHIWN